jgi:hypothetical protein
MEKKIEKVAGGYLRIRTLELCAVWALCEAGTLHMLDVRTWLAMTELRCRRMNLKANRKPRYSIEEVASLVRGVGRPSLRSSLRRLEKCRLLSARRHSVVSFSSEADLPSEHRAVTKEMLQEMPKKRVSFPLPRRMARQLMGGVGKARFATAFGQLLWCAYYRRTSGWDGRGNVTASWIARTFGVDERSVLRARAELEKAGWLSRISAPRWHTKRYGARYAVNLEWSPRPSRPEGLPTARLSPKGAEIRPRLSCLESNRSPLREEFRNQQPRWDLVGVCTRHSRDSTRAFRVDPSSLSSSDGILRLWRRACSLGLISESDADRLRFFGAAERSRRKATRNPAGFFAWSIRRGVPYLTGHEEDAARRRLAALLEPPTSRAEPVLVPRGQLSADARFARALLQVLQQRRVTADPFVHLSRERPEWTRPRWDAALRELGTTTRHREACG